MRLQRRKVTWTIAIAATVLVNIAASMPLAHKAAQWPVGNDVVFAYVPFGDSSEQPIPVMKWDRPDLNDPHGQFVDTGQKVAVLLRTSYKDDQVVWCPHITLGIILATILLNWAIDLIMSRPRPAEATEQRPDQAGQ